MTIEIPWFGPLKKLPLATPVYMGESNADGFELSVRERSTAHTWAISRGKLSAHTIEGYVPPYLLIVIQYIVLSIFCAVCSVIAMAIWDGYSFLLYFGASIFLLHVVMILAMLIYGVFASDNLREYHALEHASVELLRRGLEPSIENLSQIPKLTMNCGSSHFMMVSIILAVTGWAMMEGNTTLMLSLIGAVLFLYSMGVPVWAVNKLPRWPVFNIIRNPVSALFYYTHRWLFGITSLCCIIPPIFQHVLLLREPSQEKIEEALMFILHIQNQCQGMTLSRQES